MKKILFLPLLTMSCSILAGCGKKLEFPAAITTSNFEDYFEYFFKVEPQPDHKNNNEFNIYVTPVKSVKGYKYDLTIEVCTKIYTVDGFVESNPLVAIIKSKFYNGQTEKGNLHTGEGNQTINGWYIKTVSGQIYSKYN